MSQKVSQVPINTKSTLKVRKGTSQNPDASQAVEELRGQINQPDTSAVVVFCSSRYDLRELGAQLEKAFTAPIIGCTTSGEIGPQGYAERSIVAFSIASDQLEVMTASIDCLQTLKAAQIETIGERALERLSNLREKNPQTRAFAVLLIDGLSVREEQVVAPMSRLLGQISLIGGSAGDDLDFVRTHVYSNGRFRSDAASINVFFTTLPFATFKTQHFVPTDRKLVITGADPSHRIVSEINGKPAAREYAHLLGLELEELQPMVFSKYPVMLRIGGEYYVRSIQKVNSDGSLTFFCAIDEGLVLTLSSGVDFVSNLDHALSSASAKVSNPQVVIGCECILRRLEVIEKGLTAEVNRLMSRFNVIGFHTYGEQFNVSHVNQTFAGVMIGSDSEL